MRAGIEENAVAIGDHQRREAPFAIALIGRQHGGEKTHIEGSDLIGGTTTVIDFALQSMGHPMSEAFRIWRAKSEGKACIDYALHMAVTDLGPNDSWLDDVDAMVAEGISSFKIFMAYPNVLMVDDRTIYKLMERTKQLGALVCVHAENGTVIDAIVQEALAVGH